MMTVYKYDLHIDDRVVLSMPEGAKVLCVQTQFGIPYIWAAVDTDMPMADRVFYVRGTGHDLRNAQPSAYVGTFQLAEGSLVFHVFEG